MVTRIFVQQLGIPQNAVEWRAQLVADGADITGFGLVGLIGGGAGLLGHHAGLVCRLAGALGGFAGVLQLFVGAAVRLNFLHQQLGLAVGLHLRHLAAFVRQHQPPRHQPQHQQQGGIHTHKAGPQCLRQLPRHGMPTGRSQCCALVQPTHQPHAHAGQQPLRFLPVQQTQHSRQQRGQHQHEERVMRQACIEVGPHAARQHMAQRGRPLHRQPRVWFAQVATARIQRATERANGPLVGRAMGHVGPFVLTFANHAALQAVAQVDTLSTERSGGPMCRRTAQRQVSTFRGMCGCLRSSNVVTPLCHPGNQHRAHKRRDHGNQRRKGLRHGAHQPQMRHK